MPDRPGIHGKDRPKPKKPTPKPKKPTPDNNMDVPEDDPWITPKKKTGRGRVALQVNRKLTAKEWQTIARSMNDRRRPYAGVPVGRARVGGWRTLKPKPAFRPARHGYGAGLGRTRPYGQTLGSRRRR